MIKPLKILGIATLPAIVLAALGYTQPLSRLALPSLESIQPVKSSDVTTATEAATMDDWAYTAKRVTFNRTGKRFAAKSRFSGVSKRFAASKKGVSVGSAKRGISSKSRFVSFKQPRFKKSSTKSAFAKSGSKSFASRRFAFAKNFRGHRHGFRHYTLFRVSFFRGFGHGRYSFITTRYYLVRSRSFKLHRLVAFAFSKFFKSEFNFGSSKVRFVSKKSNAPAGKFKPEFKAPESPKVRFVSVVKKPEITKTVLKVPVVKKEAIARKTRSRVPRLTIVDATRPRIVIVKNVFIFKRRVVAQSPFYL